MMVYTQGLVTVPFWVYWTSPYSSHVQWGHLMTHDISEEYHAWIQRIDEFERDMGDFFDWDSFQRNE